MIRGLTTLADVLRLTRWPENRPAIPVLLYHDVVPPGSKIDAPRLVVRQDQLDRQLAAMLDFGFTCIPFSRVVEVVRGGPPPTSLSFAITFDDGLLDVYRHARPILESRGCSACVFIVNDRIGKTADWMRARRGGPSLLMDRHHILDLKDRGYEFGAHGCTHTPMTDLPDDRIENELFHSRMQLSEWLGQDVTMLAYPYGRFNPSVRSAAQRAGYTAAASVIAGLNRPGTDPMAIRRIIASQSDQGTDLVLKALTGEHQINWGTLVLRQIRTALTRV